MTKREAEMLAKNWRLGNKFRKKSLTKKYELKPASSSNTGRVKMGIRIDIENNPKDYKPALDDDGNLVFFTGKPMKRIQVSDLFVPPKARKENMINHKLEMLKKTFPKENVEILESFLNNYDFDIDSFSIFRTQELLTRFVSERTQYQLVALKKDGTELKSNFYDDENQLSDMQQKCEDSDEYESTSVMKRIVDVDEDIDDEDDGIDGTADISKEDNEAVDSIKDRPLVDPRDKEELYKLTTLALKQIPQSPKQKETIKKLNILRKKNGMKPLKASTITADNELTESYIIEFSIPDPEALVKKFLRRFTKAGREEALKDRMKKTLAPLDKAIEKLRDQKSDLEEALSDGKEALDDIGQVGKDDSLKRKKEQIVKKQEMIRSRLQKIKESLRNAKEARRMLKDAMLRKAGQRESVDEASVKDFNSTFAGSKAEFEKMKKDLAKNNMKVKIIKKYPDGQIDFFVQAKNPRFVKKIQKDIEKRYDASLSTIPESVQIDEKKIAGLEKKSKKSGVPYGILKQVYNRGMAAWRTGHRPGTTPQQWAFARVNSFLTGGKTRTTADKDLWAKASAAKKKKKK